MINALLTGLSTCLGLLSDPISTVLMSLRAYRRFNIVVVVLGTENGHLALQ
jgi:hypothetical protein